MDITDGKTVSDWKDLPDVDLAVRRRQVATAAFGSRVVGEDPGRWAYLGSIYSDVKSPKYGLSLEEIRKIQKILIEKYGPRVQKPISKNLNLLAALKVEMSMGERKLGKSEAEAKARGERIRTGISKKAQKIARPDAKKDFLSQFEKTVNNVKADVNLQKRLIPLAKMKDHPRGMHKVAQRVLKAAGVKYQ